MPTTTRTPTPPRYAPPAYRKRTSSGWHAVSPRCLRPGGTLTAFTFRQAERPTYRHFQRRHEQTFDVRAFRVDELVSWSVSAGLEVTDLRSPAGMLLLTARRGE